MATININNFSCLKSASFTVAPLNIIIGPQGSGKSITTKLLFFCSDLLNNFSAAAERGVTLADFRLNVAKQFVHWFPPSAWGRSRFNIGYNAGEFWVRILRRTSAGKPTNEVSVTFSEWFTELYNWAQSLFRRLKTDDGLDIYPENELSAAFDRLFRLRETVESRVSKELGNHYLGRQTFIPAGRAFFTSIGRLVAGFEQASSLDPITIKFARLFATLRDRNNQRSPMSASRLGEDFMMKRTVFMDELFGGEVRFENEFEYVQTVDGRKVPFTSLSSGQQELLPMWSIIDYFNETEARRKRFTITSHSRGNRPLPELIYIEEPESHLFPSAQSALMEFLISSSVSSSRGRSLILTTHSPYVMAKLNVFLKAGTLAKRKKRNQEINEVVPRDCWLTENQLSASAIDSGILYSLLDEDGLIDGRYLDQISEDISSEFSRLLQIESEL